MYRGNRYPGESPQRGRQHLPSPRDNSNPRSNYLRSVERRQGFPPNERPLFRNQPHQSYRHEMPNRHYRNEPLPIPRENVGRGEGSARNGRDDGRYYPVTNERKDVRETTQSSAKEAFNEIAPREPAGQNYGNPNLFLMDTSNNDFTEDVVEETFSEFPPLISCEQPSSRAKQIPENEKADESSEQPPLDAFVSKLLDSFESDEEVDPVFHRRPIPINLPPPPKGILKKSGNAQSSSALPKESDDVIEIRKPADVEPPAADKFRIEVLMSQRQKSELVSKQVIQPLMNVIPNYSRTPFVGSDMPAFGVQPISNLQHALDELRRGQCAPAVQPHVSSDLDTAVREFLEKGRGHAAEKLHLDSRPEDNILRRHPERELPHPARRASPPPRREEQLPYRSPSPGRRSRSFDEPGHDNYHQDNYRRMPGPHRSPPRRPSQSPGQEWFHERESRALRGSGRDSPSQRRLSGSGRFSRQSDVSPIDSGPRSRDWEEFDRPPKRQRSESPGVRSPDRPRGRSPQRQRSPFFHDFERERRTPPRGLSPDAPRALPHPTLAGPRDIGRPLEPFLNRPEGVRRSLDPFLDRPEDVRRSLDPVRPDVRRSQERFLGDVRRSQERFLEDARRPQEPVVAVDVRRTVRREISPPAGRNVVLRERSPSPWEDRAHSPAPQVSAPGTFSAGTSRSVTHAFDSNIHETKELKIVKESKEEEEKRKGQLLQRKKFTTKQQKLIYELYRLQTQQADLSAKQSRATTDKEISRNGQLIIENAKLQKGVTQQIQTLQKTIDKIDSSLKDAPKRENIEVNQIGYAYFDPEGHWCSACDNFHPTMREYLKHKHTKAHLIKEDAEKKSKPWRAAYKEEEEKQAKAAADNSKKVLVPVHGLDFLRPVKSWFCELCEKWVEDLDCATIHLNGTEHNEKYLKYIMENPEYEATHTMKRQLGFQRDLERRRKEKAAKEKQEEEEKNKKKEELQKNWEDFKQKEQSRNQPVKELDDLDEKKSVALNDSATKSIRVNMRKLSEKSDAKPADVKSDIAEWTPQPREDQADKQALDNLREKLKKKQQPQSAPSTLVASSPPVRQQDRIEGTSSVPVAKICPQAPLIRPGTVATGAKGQNALRGKSLPMIGRIPSKKVQEIKVATEEFIVLSEVNDSSDEEAGKS